MTYSYTDPNGDRIEVYPSAEGGARVVAYDACDGHSTSVTIDPDEAPEFVAALYRATGRTVPVMINPAEVASEWVNVPGTRGAA